MLEREDMNRQTRSLVAVTAALLAAAALILYWTQGASPIDLLYRLHGRPAPHGPPAGGHGS